MGGRIAEAAETSNSLVCRSQTQSIIYGSAKIKKPRLNDVKAGFWYTLRESNPSFQVENLTS